MSEYTMESTVSSQPPRQICTHFRSFARLPRVRAVFMAIVDGRNLTAIWGPIYQHGLNSPPVWIISHIYHKVRDKIIYPFLNLNRWSFRMDK